MIPTCTEFAWSFDMQTDSQTELEVSINYSSGTFCFETEPNEVDPNLFYDASQMMRTIQSIAPFDDNIYHQAAQVWSPSSGFYTTEEGGISQSLNQNLVTTLNFINCYTFGNGVESFRIEDRIQNKFFRLGDRVMAESNETFSEADRFAGLTYSGVFSNSSNFNNLNEFNLGLVNYKDLETNFGS